MQDFTSRFSLDSSLAENLPFLEFEPLYEPSPEIKKGIQYYENHDFKAVLDASASKFSCVNSAALRAHAFFGLSAFQNAMASARKAMESSSYFHSFFHYFGFNITSNLFYISKEVNHEKAQFYEERAKFLYKIGYENSFTFKTLENFETDLLPPEIPLCIFREGSLHKGLSECFRVYEETPFEAFNAFEEIFKKSEEEHFKYHIFMSRLHYLHGLCLMLTGDKPFARMEFEKALNMEPKNSLNNAIRERLKKL